MKSDTPWGLVIIFTLCVFIIIGGIIISIDEGRCTPERKGDTRVRGRYGGPIEVCNGNDWVPYKVQVPE